jgi:anti-anti-sigma regulatory factor
MTKLFSFLQSRAEAHQHERQQGLTLVLVSVSTLLPILLITFVVVLKSIHSSTSMRETLIVTQTREATLAQIQLAQEALIAERTAALHQALTTAEVRELQLQDALTAMQTQETTLRELSAPILPIFRGVLVAPIIGTLDTARAAVLSERVLESVVRWYASTVIFDITGVSIVDSQVAQALLHIAATARLLGASTMLVGVRPDVAQTIVSLGIDLVALRSFSTLQQAIESLRVEGMVSRLTPA